MSCSNYRDSLFGWCISVWDMRLLSTERNAVSAQVWERPLTPFSARDRHTIAIHTTTLGHVCPMSQESM